jgi:hypothetical protein
MLCNTSFKIGQSCMTPFFILINNRDWITDMNLPASAGRHHCYCKGRFLLAYHPSQRC